MARKGREGKRGGGEGGGVVWRKQKNQKNNIGSLSGYKGSTGGSNSTKYVLMNSLFLAFPCWTSSSENEAERERRVMCGHSFWVCGR